jgi:hypothetical protein
MVAPGTRGAGRTVIERAYPATPPPNEHYNSVGYLRKYNGPPTLVVATKLPPAALRAEADVAATLLASAAADATGAEVDTTLVTGAYAAAERAPVSVAATVLASAAADATGAEVDTTAGPTVGAAPNAGAAVVRISAGDAGTDAERAECKSAGHSKRPFTKVMRHFHRILSSVLNGYD